MTGVETVTVRPEDGAGRLDRWFKRHYPGLTHGRLEKLLRTGQIRVDGKRAHAGDPVAPGQAIRVPPLPETPAPSPKPGAPRARPQDAALLRDAVLYRDDWAIVVNKPAGLAVQGGTNTDRHVDALLDGLRFESKERPRLVHRLDKDTSGVLLIAGTMLRVITLINPVMEAARTHVRLESVGVTPWQLVAATFGILLATMLAALFINLFPSLRVTPQGLGISQLIGWRRVPWSQALVCFHRTDKTAV